jgi:hypothetical protein
MSHCLPVEKRNRSGLTEQNKCFSSGVRYSVLEKVSRCLLFPSEIPYIVASDFTPAAIPNQYVPLFSRSVQNVKKALTPSVRFIRRLDTCLR